MTMAVEEDAFKGGGISSSQLIPPTEPHRLLGRMSKATSVESFLKNQVSDCIRS
jgi:hypothetical protein